MVKDWYTVNEHRENTNYHFTQGSQNFSGSKKTIFFVLKGFCANHLYCADEGVWPESAVRGCYAGTAEALITRLAC